MIMAYCIFGDSQAQSTEPIFGISGQPVTIISANGLGVAVSLISPSDLTPDTDRALTYQAVVESMHRNRTVIPLRYGNVYEEEAQIVRFLLENEERLKLSLSELNGCVEMGIRVLFAESPEAERQSHESGIGGTTPLRREPSGIGHSYLAKRRALYGLDQTRARRRDAIAGHCRKAFAGLYVKFKREEDESEFTRFGLGLTGSLAHRSIFSLYFLVPRGSIDLFRQAFRELTSRESARLLLSGPWAPYNFVTDLTGSTGVPRAHREGSSGWNPGVELMQ